MADEFVRSFPVVTRTYLAGALLTTAACALEVLSPFSLYFSWTLVVEKGQVWRILTNFFFFGAKFSLEFLFHMFFLVQYCRSLEEGSFRGRTADFIWMIFLGGMALLLLSPLTGMHFLGSSLTFMMVYIWARRNPFIRMSFLGLFTFTAPYLPWVLLAFSTLLGNDALVDCVGIGVGHVYYFLEDVYPMMTPRRTRLVRTPKVVKLLLQGGGGGGVVAAEEEPLPQVDFENEARIQRAIAERQRAEQAQAAGEGGGEGAAQPPADGAQPHEDEQRGVILAQ